MRNFSEQELIRREKVKNMNKNGESAWKKSKKISHTINELNTNFSSATKEQLAQKNISVSSYGRIISKRGPFSVIFNNEAKIQIYISKNSDSQIWDLISNFDLGDIIWFEGILMKTLTNELAIRANKLVLLSKCLKVLPEKHKGLKDIEDRYRHRYVDLIVNQGVRENFRKRTKIIKEIRKFFDDRDYLEVETPILVPYLSGASAKPFTTFHNSLSKDFYLRIATELPLKKLVVGGFNKVYEIGRQFRNEGIDTTHNPEFTTIEFYEANSNMWEMMDYTEELIKKLFNSLKLSSVRISDKLNINLDVNFKRVEMAAIVSEQLGFDVKSATKARLESEAKKRNYKIEPFFEKGHLINLFFEELVEPTLIMPTFVYGHPIEISPFAVSYEDDKNFTERAELFIGTKEYANMFTELSDPIDQLERFENQIKEKELGNDEANDIDWDFVQALEYALPPAGGCGIGIDRLVMLLTNQSSIREVLLFPQMKDKDK